MKILLIGGGGREHALAWKVAKSTKVSSVFVAPGNAGTALEPKLININIAVDEIDKLVQFAQENSIYLTIVGPEVPLVLGIVDRFKSLSLRCFGPSKFAAQLEGSKTFSKEFLENHQIPTASYQSFTNIKKATAYLTTVPMPIVLKADGLAAGKGVIIADNLENAIKVAEDMLLGNKFGTAGNRVVIEQFLVGEEASFIVLSDGQNALPMASSQDHKARDNGDKGPNTGGMGAYSPAQIVNTTVHQKVMSQIVQPTIDGMAKDGHPFVGFLYVGLMIDKAGDPSVVEFNVRLGDPETQPIMMRLKSDLIDLCDAALDGKLDQVTAVWDDRVALGVVLAAGGYPDDYQSGNVVIGIPDETKDGKVFHAGTKQLGSDILTSGGRVLCVCALGDSVQDAQNKAYKNVSKIKFNQQYYRDDIGFKAIEQ